MFLGLKAADAASARVLEIGCASGGHVLPLAAMHPRAQFLGVDLSPVQIEAGERLRAALGLQKNAALKAQSLPRTSSRITAFSTISSATAFIP